jgi:hypothetical protein
MSQPALEVTGSQEVGSFHSQLTVPLAPPADADPAADDPLGELLPQAASAAMAMTEAAAAALRRVRRDLRPYGRERITGIERLRYRTYRAHGDVRRRPS